MSKCQLPYGEIRRMRSEGVKPADLAALAGVSVSHISKIAPLKKRTKQSPPFAMEAICPNAFPPKGRWKFTARPYMRVEIAWLRVANLWKRFRGLIRSA